MIEPTSRHIARSAVWNHLGKVAEFALFFASTVVIARALGVEGNGRLAAILSAIQLLIVLSSAGIEVSLNKHLPQRGTPGPGTRFLINRLLRLRLVLFFAVALAGLLAVRVLRTDWSGFLGLILVLGMLRSLAPVLSMLLVARFDTAKAAAVGILARSAELVALVAMTGSLNITTVLVIFIVGSGVQVIGYAIASRTEWAGQQERVPVAPVVAFGAVFWLNTIVDYFLGRQGDVMFLTALRSESASASLYDVAYSIVQIGMMALTVGLGGVVLAAMSQYAATDRSRMNALYHVTVRVTSLLTIPFLAYLAVEAPDLIALVYSDAYAGAADVLRILLCLRIASRLFASGENADYLLALGKVWTVVRIGIIAACVTVAMHLCLIPHWGAIGAAVASGSGVLLANALGGITAMRVGGVAMQWRTWIRVVAPVVCAGAVSLALPHTGSSWLQILYTGVVFFGLFAFILTVTRPLYREDLDAVRSAVGGLPRVFHLIAR